MDGIYHKPQLRVVIPMLISASDHCMCWLKFIVDQTIMTQLA